jgi:predicted PurR-regulated permease PerM
MEKPELNEMKQEGPSGERMEYSIPTATLVRACALLLAFVVVAAIAYVGRQVLMLTFAGLLFGIALAGAADWLTSKTPLSRGWALLVTCLLLVAVVAGGAWFLGAQIAREANQLADEVPASLGKLRDELRQHPLLARLDPGGQAQQAMQEQARQQAQQIPAKAGHALAQIANLGGGLVLFFFLGLFFAASPQVYRAGFLHLVPLRGRSRAAEVLDALGHTLRHWLLGLAVAMVSAAVMTGVALWLLKVPMALALALLAGVGEIVPNFGPIAAAGPAVLLSLVDSPARAGLVVLAYVVIQTVQSYLITPMVQDKAIHMPPAVQIVSQVLMGVVLGPLGLIIATPLVAVVMVLVRMLYVEDRLGDELSPAGES